MIESGSPRGTIEDSAGAEAGGTTGLDPLAGIKVTVWSLVESFKRPNRSEARMVPLCPVKKSAQRPRAIHGLRFTLWSLIRKLG